MLGMPHPLDVPTCYRLEGRGMAERTVLMARSNYIYIAVQRLGYDYSDDPVGVWTVKKEMLDAISHRWTREPRRLPDWIWSWNAAPISPTR